MGLQLLRSAATGEASILVLTLCDGASRGVWNAQVAAHPEATGFDHIGLEALGNERGSVLALHTVDLPRFARGSPCAVCHSNWRVLHGFHRLPHPVFRLCSLESVAESYVRCIGKRFLDRR